LGTDWLQYARNGAAVVVCSSSTSQLELIRRHFQLRGLEGRFLHSSPWCLPLEPSSIDVACISGLLQDVDEPQRVVEEVFRVLKPGGKVIAVTPAKYDVDYWRNVFFFWERWLGRKRREPARDERRFTSRRLRRLFHRFEIHRIARRQLRRSELPHLWRLWPLPLLERVLGRVLVLKAFKPISAAMQALAAA
jgi:SAM-dependent methyltransferase